MWFIPFFFITMGVAVVFYVIYFAIIQPKRMKKTDNQLIQNGFSITRSAGVLRVDDKNRKWCINNGIGEIKIFDFSEVVDCKIEENSVLNKVNKLGVYIYTLNNGALYINLINAETKRDSFVYNSSMNEAQQICSLVQSMKAQPAVSQGLPIPTIPVPTNSVANSTAADDVEEQLKKFKSMVDSGIITQEDYEAKKKQLLGL